MSPAKLRLQLDPEMLEAFEVYRSGPFCVVKCTHCRKRIYREPQRVSALPLVYLMAEHALLCFAPLDGTALCSQDGAGS